MMKKPPKKILVIDDDPGTIRLLEKWLRVGGRLTITAANAASGLSRAKKENPDLILLDIRLPDLNGVELARLLHRNPVTKDIPIIFITISIDVKKDKGDQFIEVDGVSLRAFAKPLHNPKLLNEIRKAINRQKNQNLKTKRAKPLSKLENFKKL